MTTAELKQKEIKARPINKQIKAEFIKLKCDRENYKTEQAYLKWQKWYNTEHYEDVFKLNDTEYYPLEKHHLETRFCFGYGYCLQSTEEESDSAFEQSRKAKEDVTFFINENLQKINCEIATIKYHIIPAENWEERQKYFNEVEKQNLMRYGQQMCNPYICSFYNDMRGIEVKLSYFNELKDEHIIKEPYVLRKATKEELEIILDNLIQYRLRLVKRLNTYLKKYGLEHITSWTYLRD